MPEHQPGSSAAPKKHKWWEPVLELVMHVLIGSLLFAVIFTPAVLLDLGLGWLKSKYHISDFLANLLVYTKYFVGGLDALLYVIWMVNLSWLFVGKLKWKVPSHD